MKGWSTEALTAKGVKFTVVGGAGAATAPAKPAPLRVIPSATPQDMVAIAAKTWTGVERLAIELPSPPGLNNAYVNAVGKGRRKSPRAIQFYEDATAAVANLGQRLAADTYRAHIVITREHPRADIDGRAKLLLDVLVKCGIIPDDRFCEKLEIEWRYRHAPGATVMFTKYRKRRAA